MYLQKRPPISSKQIDNEIRKHMARRMVKHVENISISTKGVKARWKVFMVQGILFITKERRDKKWFGKGGDVAAVED